MENSADKSNEWPLQDFTTVQPNQMGRVADFQDNMMASAVSNADEADSISWISKVPRKGRPEPQPQSTRYEEQ